MARPAKSRTLTRSRSGDRRITWNGSGEGMRRSAPVTLLVLGAGAAPAWVVPSDPLPAGRETGLRSAGTDRRSDAVARHGLIAERGAHRATRRWRRWSTAQDCGAS